MQAKTLEVSGYALEVQSASISESFARETVSAVPQLDRSTTGLPPVSPTGSWFFVQERIKKAQIKNK
jgi:hypothetical protein